MAITAIQTTQIGYNAAGGGTSQTTPNFGSPVVAGNLIVVGIRNVSGSDTVSGVTDTVGTTYARACANTASGAGIYIYWGIAAGSGTNAVTATISGPSYTWVLAREVSGISGTSPVDVADAHSGSGDPTSNANSTVQADEYAIMFVGQDTFAAYTVGAGWTLIDDSIPDATNPNFFGAAQEKILSAPWSGVVATMASSQGAPYGMALATFKAGPSGGPTYDQTDTIAEAGATVTSVDYFSQILRPTTTVAAGTWTPSTGSSLPAMIDEGTPDDADYIESAATGTTDTPARIRLPASPTGVPPTPRGDGSHRLNWRYQKGTAGGDQVDLRVRLLRADGTTVVASQTVTDIGAATTGTLVLTGVEADSIPDADYGIGLIMEFERL